MGRQAVELLTAHFPFLNHCNEKHLSQKKMNETIWRNDSTAAGSREAAEILKCSRDVQLVSSPGKLTARRR